jgi:two-component system response regulator HydG
LHERSQDIPILIDYFMRQFTAQHGKQIRGMSPAARHKLLCCDWPGNVRQLRNVVEGMVVVDYDGLLDVDDLPEDLTGPVEATAASATASLAALVGKPLEEVERLFVTETLRATGGNREDAAQMLGMGERTLYRKIKEYGL